MEKKNKLLVGLIIVISLILLSVAYFVITKSSKEKELKLVAEYEELIILKNEDYSSNNSSDSYLVAKKNNKYGLIDFEGKVIEEIKYDVIRYLADDYYYVEIDDVKTLKRNGNIVADITNYEKEKVYKDNSDETALYIMLNEYMYNKQGAAIDEVREVIVLDGNLRAVYYKDNQNISGVEVKTSSIVYNAETGEIVSKIPGKISKGKDSNYYVNYRLATYMSAGTYYDKEFNNIMGNNDYYFSSSQCDGNNYAKVVTNSENNKYGYYSILNKKLILPIEYENIYSVNSNETLFVVKENNKYALLDNTNKILLPSEYDYMVIENNYIIAIKDEILNIYDKNIKKLEEYTYTIDTGTEIAIGGLCEPEYKYINYQQYSDENLNKLLAKLVVSTTEGLKTLLFVNNEIKLFNDNQVVTIEYAPNENNNYIIISDIANNLINNISIYNLDMNKLYDIPVTNYNISLEKNGLPLDGGDSIYNVSYNFDCKYFTISYNYNDINGKMEEVYFDIKQDKIVEEVKYLSCKDLDENYLYYPIYNDENYREKYALYDDKDNKIIEFKQDIEKINNNYIIVDRSKLYKLS